MTTSRTSSELRALFADQTYMHTRVPADGYLYEGYLADLNAYWDDAEHHARAQIAAGEAPDAFAECLRAALIRTSINSVARNIPPNAAARAVELGAWSPERAVAIALRIGEDRPRVAMLAALLKTGLLPEALHIAAKNAALDAARRLWSLKADAEWIPKTKLASLEALVAHLTPPQMDEALSVARAFQFDSYRSEALSYFVPHLAEPERTTVLEEALTAARAIETSSWRSIALCNLIQYLPEVERPSLVNEVVALADTAKTTSHRNQIISHLLPHLSEAERLTALPELLSDARAITRLETRTRRFIMLIPYVPDHERSSLIAEALTTARTLEYTFVRVDVLSDLVPYLSREQLFETLTMAYTFEDTSEVVVTLLALIPYIPEPERDEHYGKLLKITQNIRNSGRRFRLLSRITPFLPTHRFAEALTIARAIESESDRLRALTAIAAHLPKTERLAVLTENLRFILAHKKREYLSENVLSELAAQLPLELLVEAVKAVQPDTFIEMFRALVPHLPPDLLAEVFTRVHATPDGFLRLEGLHALVPYLPPDLLVEAVTLARSINDDYDRSLTLKNIAPYLPEPVQASVWAEAVSAARAVNDDDNWKQRQRLHARIRALRALLAYLPPDLMAEVLTDARTSGNIISLISALTDIAPCLPSQEEAIPLWSEALHLIQSEQMKDVDRSYLLRKMIQALVKGNNFELLESVLTASSTIQAEFHRVVVLQELAPYLPSAVLSAAAVMQDEYQRSKVYSILAPHASAALMDEVLAAARTINHRIYRAHDLNTLLAFTPEAEHPRILTEIRTALIEGLRLFESDERSNLLWLFKYRDLFSPPILSPECLAECARHIFEITTQWEWL